MEPSFEIGGKEATNTSKHLPETFSIAHHSSKKVVKSKNSQGPKAAKKS
jgi:hypothetical protein